MNETKVLLANPPKPKKSNIQTFYPSLGLLYLASYAETYSNISNLEIIHLEGNLYDPEEFVDRIVKINPDIVGLSIATTNSLVAYEAINRLKAEVENARVICGGPHVTAIPFDVLKKSKADVCVIGEGEVTFLKLLEAYKENKKQSDIPGIAFRKNGSMFLTPDRDLIKDLDSIPFPAWDKVHLENYGGTQFRKAWPDVCMLSTRGCPYNCTFCSNPVWKHCKPWIRLRSPKNVAKEVSYLANLGAKEIYDFADEFNASLEWSVKVAEEISHVNEDIFFKVQLRADKITEELARSLKKMGCWIAFVGIESGNQEVLDGVNKKIRLEQVVKGLRLLKKYDIKTHGYFMIFNVWEKNGELRFENPKMCEKTLRFARELISGGLLDNISWSIATPEPGSQLYDISLRHELIDENMSFSDMSGDKIMMKLPGISRRDISWIKFKGMSLQLYCSIFHGDINWRDSSYLAQKVRILLDFGLSSVFSR